MPTRRHPSTLAVVGAVLALLLLAGCGDDSSDSGDSSDGRPSVDEVAEELAADGRLTEEQAQCIAEAFVNSEVSDKALNAVVETGDLTAGQADLDEADEAAVQVAATAALDCATQGFQDELESSTTTTAAG